MVKEGALLPHSTIYRLAGVPLRRETNDTSRWTKVPDKRRGGRDVSWSLEIMSSCRALRGNMTILLNADGGGRFQARYSIWQQVFLLREGLLSVRCLGFQVRTPARIGQERNAAKVPAVDETILLRMAMDWG